MAEQIKFGDRLFLTGEKLVLDNGAKSLVLFLLKMVQLKLRVTSQ